MPTHRKVIRRLESSARRVLYRLDMIARTHCAFQEGVSGRLSEIEAAVQPLPPQIQVTGLPAEVVRESRERIRVALAHLGFDLPNQKIVVHLSPAHSKKEGSHFDLAMALACLAAEERLRPEPLVEWGLLGELALDGTVRRVRNILPLLFALVAEPKFTQIIVPRANLAEVGLLKDPRLRLVETLAQVIEAAAGRAILPEISAADRPRLNSLPREEGEDALDRVEGHALAKRALEIAIAGRHHFLMVGSPGVGKSLLANAAAGLLPPLREEELLEVAMLHSAKHDFWEPSLRRPFRSPHHSVSTAGFLGGGSGPILPGEISLSHRGVLFLDELPEFRRDCLEGLREPLQEGQIHVHRVAQAYSLPARFTLLAAMNPCPCGNDLNPERRCDCPYEKKLAYRRKISGPLWDRCDLGAVMHRPSDREISVRASAVRERIEAAWEIQFRRYQSITWNGDQKTPKPPAFQLPAEGEGWLNSLLKGASLRRYYQIVRLARTIADLAGAKKVLQNHLEEAWLLRCPELPS